MNKKLLFFFTFFAMLFIFSGCVQREIVIPKHDSRQSQGNIWAQQTNIQEEENVDISDLDQKLTEKETIITENAQQQKMERINFPIGEYSRLPRSGKGTVKGSIYINDAYGKRVVGAGTRLYLNPVTSYSKQWYNQSYIGGYKMQKADSRLFNYLRFTASDAGGNFAFYGVPSGQYYLIGTVKCGTQCGYSTPKSIRITTLVSVQGNQIVQKDLSRMVD